MGTKKRLVDINEFITNPEFDCGDDRCDKCYMGFPCLMKALKNAPTVDAIPVVHANWEEWFPGDCALIMTGEEMLYRCPVCDAKYPDVEGFKFCPHCAAKMDG